MAVVGIDQSLTGTGVAQIENDGNLVRMQLLKTGKLRGVERLAHIASQLCVFLEEVGERFVAAREGYSFGSQGRATFSLGELGGCVDLTLFNSRPGKIVEYYLIPPNVHKKYCLGSGAVKKDSSYLLTVLNKTGLEFPDDNQADAYMIATTLLGFLMGRNPNMSTFFEGLTLPQKEALLSAKMGKKGSGVTKATVKKMEHEQFAGLVAEVLESYKAF